MSWILYVEDEEWQIEGTITTVIENECDDVEGVDTAVNIEEARKMLKEKNYDLVILDIMMNAYKKLEAGKTGLSLLPDTTKTNPKIQVIVVSGIVNVPAPQQVEEWKGKTVSEVIRDVFHVPYKRIFRKPVDINDLVAAVNDILSGGGRDGG